MSSQKLLTIFRKRLSFVYVMLLVAACVLMIRIFSLQVPNHEYYADIAYNQYVNVVGDTIQRNGIFFRVKDGGLLSAATMKYGYKLFVDPRAFVEKSSTEKDYIFSVLESYIPDISKDAYDGALAKIDDPYEELAWQLNDEIRKKINEEKLDGVRFARDWWRIYPGNESASHVIGFAAFNDNNEFRGTYGIEHTENDILSHADQVKVNVFAEIFSAISGTTDAEENIDASQDVVITIEPHVQAFIDSQTKNLKDEFRADLVGTIVVDPQTGEIIALSNSTMFDLNNFSDVEGNHVYTNPFVQHVYELGSIMKPLVMAMGFDEGKVTPETVYYDAGSVEVADYTIHNFDKRGRGNVTMRETLIQSLNTGMVYIMNRLSRDSVRGRFDQLGFNDKTGAGLPYEVSGLTANLEKGREVEFANISFGQGLAVTPMAMVKALTVLANDGYVAPIHITYGYQDENDYITPVQYSQSDAPVFSSEAIEDVTSILVELVDDSFKKKFPQLEPYNIAAKTGTAQIANPSGGYYDDRNLHSFFGYFPAYDPEFLVFSFIVNPKGVRYASETLGAPFMRSVDFLVNYYDIPPDRLRVE